MTFIYAPAREREVRSNQEKKDRENTEIDAPSSFWIVEGLCQSTMITLREQENAHARESREWAGSRGRGERMRKCRLLNGGGGPHHISSHPSRPEGASFEKQESCMEHREPKKMRSELAGRRRVAIRQTKWSRR